MQTKPARKNSTLIVKHVSGKVISESHTPAKGHVIVCSKTGQATSRHSAILVVETKNERVRTIKEYEKQRDALRSVIAR